MIILAIILIIVFWKEIVMTVYSIFGLIFALIGSLFYGICDLFDSNRKH